MEDLPKAPKGKVRWKKVVEGGGKANKRSGLTGWLARMEEGSTRAPKKWQNGRHLRD